MEKYHDNYWFGGNGEKTLMRDGYKCVKCGMTNSEHLESFGVSITVDHIDGKGRNSKVKNHELDNLQTLCLPCHGKKDFDKTKQKLSDEQIEEVINLYKSGMKQKDIGIKYNVTQAFISLVLSGKRRIN